MSACIEHIINDVHEMLEEDGYDVTDTYEVLLVKNAPIASLIAEALDAARANDATVPTIIEAAAVEIIAAVRKSFGA